MRYSRIVDVMMDEIAWGDSLSMFPSTDSDSFFVLFSVHQKQFFRLNFPLMGAIKCESNGHSRQRANEFLRNDF
jgi:hypothetical protein